MVVRSNSSSWKANETGPIGRLFEPDCQSPRQMKLANAFCRFLEVAPEVRMDPRADGRALPCRRA